MVTSLLDLLGLCLLVAAAVVAFGLSAGLFVAGGCCLFVSWSLARSRK